MDRPGADDKVIGDVKCLETVKLTAKHLTNNSAVHKNAFSAIAELVDNSYDAGANWCRVDMVGDNMHERIEILDNGKGMSRAQALGVIRFGFSEKDGDDIGRYGNGLKSGAFHLGRDVLLLTKQDDVNTVVFISRTLLDAENVNDTIYVPCPSLKNGEPYSETAEDLARFNDEIKYIYRHAPLGPDEYLTDLFSRIEGDSGTLLIIGKLLREVNGNLSLRRVGDDLLIDGDAVPRHKTSLREYLRVLYLYPKMGITLCSVEVQARKLIKSWMGLGVKNYSIGKEKTEGFRMTLFEHQQELEAFRARKKGLNSEQHEMNNMTLTIAAAAKKRKKLDHEVAHVDGIINAKEALIKAMSNDVKEKRFDMKFGLEVKHREEGGIHFYVNNRLIVWGHQTPFLKKNPHLVGISAYCHLEFNYFRPTQNKQGFVSTKDFKSLVRAFDGELLIYRDYLEKFWLVNHLKSRWQCTVPSDGDVWDTFWRKWGHFSVKNVPRTLRLDQNQIDILQKECGLWMRCATCGAWRYISSSSNPDLNVLNTNYDCPAIPIYLHHLVDCFKPEDTIRTDFEAGKNLDDITKMALERATKSKNSGARPNSGGTSSVPAVPSLVPPPRTTPTRAVALKREAMSDDDDVGNDGDDPNVDTDFGGTNVQSSSSSAPSLAPVRRAPAPDDRDEVDSKKNIHPVVVESRRRQGGEPDDSHEPSKRLRIASSRVETLSRSANVGSTSSSSNRTSSSGLARRESSGREKRHLMLLNDILKEMGKPPITSKDPLPTASAILKKHHDLQRKVNDMSNNVEELFKNNISLDVGSGQHFRFNITSSLTPVEKLRKAVTEEIPRLKKQRRRPVN